MLGACDTAQQLSRTNTTLDIITFLLLLLFCLFSFPDWKDNLMSKNGRAEDHKGCEQGTHHRQTSPSSATIWDHAVVRAQVQMPFETMLWVGSPTAPNSPGSLSNNAATLTMCSDVSQKPKWSPDIRQHHCTAKVTSIVFTLHKILSLDWPLPILNPLNTVTLPIFIWKLLNECSLMYFIWSINLMAKSARALICVFPSLSYVESLRPDAAIYVLPMVLIFSSCRNWSSLIICFTRAKEVNKPW